MQRKYTQEQRNALQVLIALHGQKVHQKAVIRAQVEAEIAERIEKLSIKESRAASEAFELGVTKTDIGRAIGTSHWQTIQDTIMRTTLEVADLAVGIADTLERREDGWYATSPDGCTMPLVAGLKQPRIDEKPGPEGQEWLTESVLPTAEWDEWFAVNGDAIREYVSGAA